MTKIKTTDDGYRADPIAINSTSWFYEEPKGVTIVQEHRDVNGKHLCTLQNLIPWRLLCAAVERHRVIAKRKAK